MSIKYFVNGRGLEDLHDSFSGENVIFSLVRQVLLDLGPGFRMDALLKLLDNVLAVGEGILGRRLLHVRKDVLVSLNQDELVAMDLNRASNIQVIRFIV